MIKYGSWLWNMVSSHSKLMSEQLRFDAAGLEVEETVDDPHFDD
jgi:hypothetical protein